MNKIINFIKSLKVSELILTPAASLGRAKTSNSLSKENFLNLTRNILNYKLVKNNYVPIALDNNNNRINCGAGSNFICLTPSGDVKPCQMFDSLKGIFWKNKNMGIKYLFENNSFFKTFKSLPEPNSQTCNDCKHNDGFCLLCYNRAIEKIKTDVGSENCIWYKNLNKTQRELINSLIV